MQQIFAQKADKVIPKIIETKVSAVNAVKIKRDKNGFAVIKKLGDAEEYCSSLRMKKGDSITVDFGTHYVGYISFDIKSHRRPPDAPLYFHIRFGENAYEMTEDAADQNTGLSYSWVQQEYMHIDLMPCRVELPRRYAFRYMEITVVAASACYEVSFENFELNAVSSMDISSVVPLNSKDKLLNKIDEASIRTMVNCTQDFYEDGPKRDRRLWSGDLRLEALVAYDIFKNYDVSKRCLYLFAATVNDDGQIPACLYTKPKIMADDIYMYDYSLFFVNELLDYYKASGDKETALDLYETAINQIKCAMRSFDKDGLYLDDKEDCFANGCFLDWNSKLNRQAGAQGIAIYAIKAAIELSVLLKKDTAYLEDRLECITTAAVKFLWDDKKGVFVSGSKRQISYASQVWMVYAGVFDKVKNAEILRKIAGYKNATGMVTPYMHHHYTEAMLMCGMKKEALSHIKKYWGGMIKLGADTFWEIYSPENPYHSPYGSSTAINSYCHGWSSTPAYLIRKYNLV